MSTHFGFPMEAVLIFLCAIALSVYLDLFAHRKVKEISVKDIFTENTLVTDYYSDKNATVINGKITIDSSFGMVLLGVKR